MKYKAFLVAASLLTAEQKEENRQRRVFVFTSNTAFAELKVLRSCERAIATRSVSSRWSLQHFRLRMRLEEKCAHRAVGKDKSRCFLIHRNI
jgi:hypothetical protein